jgi:RNA polymerase sigma-70 factor (ECF subfamily)
MRPVLRNLAIDQGRRARRLRPLDEGSAQTCPVEQEPPCWAALDRSHVERALGQCSPELRTAFELHYWHALPIDEIAGRLGVPRATVGTRLHRARLRIRRVLERGTAVAEA